VVTRGLYISTPDGSGDVLNGMHRRARIGETLMMNEEEARSHINKVLPPDLYQAKLDAERTAAAIVRFDVEARPTKINESTVEPWPTVEAKEKLAGEKP